MAKQRVEIELDVPEGFTFDGIGDVKTDQWFIGRDSLPQIANYYSPGPFVRLKKVEPVRESRWRNVYPLSDPHYCVGSHDSVATAIAAQAGLTDIRIERVDYENGVVVRVELEPVAASIEEA